MTTLTPSQANIDISYGIYTIERLPKGSRRTAKWDLHSIAKDRIAAEMQAKTLSAQPYFDHIEVQEFRSDQDTKKRVVSKIRSYSRHSSLHNALKIAALLVAIALIGAIIF